MEFYNAGILGFWRFPDVGHQIHSVRTLSSQAWYLPRWRISRPASFESWKLRELPNLTKAYCCVLSWWIFYFIHPSWFLGLLLGLICPMFLWLQRVHHGDAYISSTSLSSIPAPFSSWAWTYCLTEILGMYSGAGQSLLDALGYALKTDINYPGRVSYWKALNKALWDPNLRI